MNECPPMPQSDIFFQVIERSYRSPDYVDDYFVLNGQWIMCM